MRAKVSVNKEKMGCCSSKAAHPKGMGKSTNKEQAIEMKRSSSMYVTTKGELEDHNPPELDSDGYLVPEEVEKRITGSESVCKTTVGEDEKTDIEVMRLFDLDSLRPFPFLNIAFIESRSSLLP